MKNRMSILKLCMAGAMLATLLSLPSEVKAVSAGISASIIKESGISDTASQGSGISAGISKNAGISASISQESDSNGTLSQESGSNGVLSQESGRNGILSQESSISAGITAVLGDSLASKAAIAQPAEALPVSSESQNTSIQEDATIQEDTTICGYEILGVADVENNLNIREGAGEEYDLVGKLPRNGGCEILETEGEWFKIKSGKVTGYVKREFILIGDAARMRADEVKQLIATTNTQTVYLRTEPNTDCTIWTAMPEGEDIYVIEDQGEWIKVDLDGDECYVYSLYVDISEQLPKAMTMTEIRYGEGVSDVRVALVNYACQFIGNPYVWGGTSLTKGADCSGFTMQVFAKYGVYLPRNSRAQAGCGTKVSSSEAKPGDLFFYSKGGVINHVAIYIGNDQVVHASSPSSGIKISNAYYRTPTYVKRVIYD